MNDIGNNPYWPIDGCLICGRARNKWCDEFHLPLAEAEVVLVESRMRRYKRQFEAYKAAAVEER